MRGSTLITITLFYKFVPNSGVLEVSNLYYSLWDMGGAMPHMLSLNTGFYLLLLKP